MRVPFEFRDRAKAYKNARDRSVISAAIRGSVYRDVPLDGLVATQRSVNDGRVHQYATGEAEPPSRHSPVVLEHRGRWYIHNGHHRAAAELERGNKTLRARVATLDGPKRFAAHSAAGTLLMIDPRAMAAGYMPREEPCCEVIDGVAVLTIEGPLESKPGMAWFAYFDDYESIMARFTDVLASDDVQAVLLKIDSPGGMAAGLNATVDAMRKLKKQAGKPVVAYADEKCCSAAYALACVADEIYLPPAAEIGSIGVTSTLVDATDANKKAGLKVTVVTSGKRKADGNPDVQTTPEMVKHVQKRVDHLADIYYRLVEKARGLSVKEVRGLEANTFDGQNAVDVGLADGVATLETVLRTMRDGLGEQPTLDRAAGGVTDNVLDGKARERSTMTLKLKRKAVAKAERALALAKAELNAAEKTPPAHASDEEDEEKKAGKSKTKRVKRTEEIEEEEIGSSDGSSAPDDESSPPAEEDEEEAAESSAEEAADEADEEEAEGDEEDEEEATAHLLALAQSATGKKGSKAIGALAAMLAEGRRAAKQVNRIASERRAEKKELAIETALAKRRITRHEAKDLRGKSSSFVKSFLSMRKRPLIATDEEELRTPGHKMTAELPKEVRTQIELAVAALPEAQRADARKQLVEAHRDRLAGANGAGRY